MSALVIASANEKLAHTPAAKLTRTEAWTACGKRIRTTTLVRLTAAAAVELGYAVCACVPC